MMEQRIELSKAVVLVEPHRALMTKLFAFGIAMCCAITILLIPSNAFGQALQTHKRPAAKRVPPESAAKPSFENDLAAAEGGDAKAQLRVGRALYNGTERKRNFAEAFKWFDAASKQGSSEATAWMGICYLSGQGVTQDMPKGAALIQSSAANNDPVGLRFLGELYQTGQGVPRDYAKAASAFGKAARLNDPESFDKLGKMFLRGVGVKKDIQKATRLFTRGARLGDSWAQLNLGELYESGNFMLPNSKKASSVSSLAVAPLDPLVAGDSSISDAPPNKPNFVRAIRLFSRSAAQGNRVAAFKLGELYETGRGTAPDIQKALNFYRQSAAQQYAPAQLALGRVTELGQGTPVNLTFAYLWYSLAAAQENTEARQRLDSLARKLTPAQVDEAQGLLSQLQSKINGN